MNGDSVLFEAGSGEANHLQVTYGWNSIAMTDSGAPITAGSGCTSVTPENVVCSVTAFELRVALGDLDDSLVSTWAVELFIGSPKSPVPRRQAQFDGGPGDDTLESANHWSGYQSHLEFLTGGPGNDVLTDRVGGPSHTYSDGGAGADVFGGADHIVVYADRLNPISVTTDGVANDGEAGEGDQVPSTISVVVGGAAGDTIAGGRIIAGGPGDDTLTGGPETNNLNGGLGNDTISVAASTDLWPWLDGGGGDDLLVGGSAADRGDYLYGGSGDDTLVGLAGCDRLVGQRGDDTIRGADGSDMLFGGSGADLLYGGNGADAVYGEGGLDRLAGGSGADFLFARDLSRDRVEGGPGRDRARINRGDIVRRIEAFPPRLTEPSWMAAIPIACYYTGQ